MVLKIIEGGCRRLFVLPLSGTDMVDDLDLSLSVCLSVCLSVSLSLSLSHTHTHTHVHAGAKIGFVTQSFVQELASRRKMGGGRQSPILLSLHSLLHNIGRKTVECYQVLICLLLLLVWILAVADGYAL